MGVCLTSVRNGDVVVMLIKGNSRYLLGRCRPLWRILWEGGNGGGGGIYWGARQRDDLRGICSVRFGGVAVRDLAIAVV